MLVFTHIPRTGGTTINLNFLAGTRPKDQIQIRGNYKKEEIYTFQAGRRFPSHEWLPVSFEIPCTDIVKLIAFLHSSDISKIKLIKGHLPYGVHNYIEGSCYYFTVLREPITRVWSVYNGVLIDENHYLHNIWRDQYHWDLIEILKDHPPELCNDQFRMILGTSNVHFTSSDLKKIPDIVANYSYITTSDKISEIGSKFGYLFRWQHMMLMQSFNVANYKVVGVTSISGKLRQMIYDCNQQDVALYNYVRERGVIFNMYGGFPSND